METEGSSWFSAHKLEVAQAYVLKDNDHILALKAALEAAFEKLDNLDVNAWKLEGASLMKCMEEVALGLTGMETNVGVTKVAGGIAAVLGGALGMAAIVLSAAARPFVPGVGIPLAIASSILGAAASVTSLGTEVAKCSTSKRKLKDLQTRYDSFVKDTQSLEQVLNELLELLKQASQLLSHMFSSLELAEEATRKAFKLQVCSPYKTAPWPLDMENLGAEGCVIMEAVGAIAKEGEYMKMTNIGKALGAVCKNPVGVPVSSPILGQELKDLHLHLEKKRMLVAGLYWTGGMGAVSSVDTNEDARGVVLLSTGAGAWDFMEGVKSLHRGSHAARALRQCVQTMQETIIPLQKVLDILM